MKYTFLVVAALTAFVGTVKADSVSCSVIDYLYYSSDCCDNSNSVQCMESIPQTDKAAIDNLASLKRSDGTACQSGDSIKFLSNIGTGSSGIVCADEDACVIPCLNGGTISGSLSGNDCLCTCATGFSGDECGTVIPCPTVCQNNGTVNGTVADGDCGCNCSATGGYTGDNCENAPAGPAPAPTFTLVTDQTGWDVNSPKLMTEQECRDMVNDADLLSALQDAWTDSTTTLVDMTFASAYNGHAVCQYYPKGCSLRLGDEKLYWNDGLDGNGAACSNTLFVPTIPIPNDGASTYFPVLNP